MSSSPAACAGVVATVLILVLVCGIVQLADVSSAVAYGLVRGIVAFLVWGFGPRLERWFASMQQADATPQGHPVSEAFAGEGDLLTALEHTMAGCGRIVRGLGADGQDVFAQQVELNHLATRLMGLKGEYARIWTLDLNKRLTVIQDRLMKASEVPGLRDVELVRAYIGAAVSGAKPLIAELKSPPRVNTDKNTLVPPANLPEPPSP